MALRLIRLTHRHDSVDPVSASATGQFTAWKVTVYRPFAFLL
ncbi:hypothetical protein A464_4110 [Salmonella bongori N268-08]|uniref:Uncharacterized protein n=1 Tax=Salmonella bongori N268-08 TaxID=1197719 RepID=S5N2P8_SALBN|nr:hypothetical protein A464_4110 [Salmonella bongori N268-08]